MDYHLLEGNAGNFASRLFLSPYQQKYPYHNLEHTAAVVKHVKEIGQFYKIEPADSCMLCIAAWFHDTGQLFGSIEGHEEKSRIVMVNYLENFQLPAAFITKAGDCILATKPKAEPVNLVEKIICDADTYHFGTDYFMKTEWLMKKEMEMRKGKPLPQWHHESLALLKTHVFYTEYCQLALNEGKKKNIQWLQSLIVE